MTSVRRSIVNCIFALLAALAALPAVAQSMVQDVLAEQRAAMQTLAHFDGVWRGTSTIYLPSGEKRTGHVTHRVGPFLGGTIKVMEGRSYNEEGVLVFNGMMVLFYESATKSFQLHSFANGRARQPKIAMTADGYYFEVPMEDGATRRVTITVKKDSWSEVVQRLAPGAEPVRLFEMTLARAGDSDWPAAYPNQIPQAKLD